MSMFIRCEVNASVAGDAGLAKQLASVCPVDIFAVDEDGRARVVEENQDECILCGLCLDVGPPGAVQVVKLYDGEKLLERG